MGRFFWKLLKILGNVVTLGLYQWLKNKYGDKS